MSTRIIDSIALLIQRAESRGVSAFCGFQDNECDSWKSLGLVTLLELLRVHAAFFVQNTFLLALYRDELREHEEHEDQWATILLPKRDLKYWAKIKEEFIPVLSRMKARCEAVDLPMTASMCDTIVDLAERKLLKSTHIETVIDSSRRELNTKLFLVVPHSRKDFFDEPLRDWQRIVEAFPIAQEDIEEMNKCYALSRYTASVFHSLLVVEHGVIALGHHINVTDPKPGWDATYRKLDDLIRNRVSIPTHLDSNFLEQTKARLDSMKLAWRNKVNHAAGRLMIEKTGFNDESAEEVIIACRSFMRHLAEGLPK